METKIISKTADLQSHVSELRKQNLIIGFVPTMGALHEGHAELIRNSVAENDVTILSLFVNPTQFNNPEDFAKYPKTFESDLKMAKELGVDIVFAPETEKELYPDGYTYKVTETHFSKKLCGAYRPGHFDGVLTVVLKLLNITQCHHAYFGEKDYQQLTLVKNMVEAFFLPTKIKSIPTKREPSGLPLSSRNTRLTLEGKEKAAKVYSILREHKELTKCQEALLKQGFQVEYLEDYMNRRYIAFYVEGVRLIDNVSLAE
jgi:pantoate--beta-alanine ligase